MNSKCVKIMIFSSSFRLSGPIERFSVILGFEGSCFSALHAALQFSSTTVGEAVLTVAWAWRLDVLGFSGATLVCVPVLDGTSLGVSGSELLVGHSS